MSRHEEGVAAENRDSLSQTSQPETLVMEAPGKDEGSHLSPPGGTWEPRKHPEESPAAAVTRGSTRNNVCINPTLIDLQMARLP